MVKKSFILIVTLLVALSVSAESWDEVVNSGEYYYGIGMAESQEDASNAALANMMSSIVVHVSSDFEMLEDETITNGNVDSKTRVRNCLNTYSQGSFTNVRTMTQKGKGKDIQVLRYMHRSELENIYQQRIGAAKNWVRIADDALDRLKIDMALQYYYWAYSLVRSLQHPYEAKDDQGQALATVLPIKIREILSKIDVQYESQEESFVNLIFTYDGKPLSCIDFDYNDGQSLCEDNRASNGRGCLEMASGYEDNSVFHVSIQYEYKSQARGDSELQSVLNVVPKAIFREASHQVKRDAKAVAGAAKPKQQVKPGQQSQSSASASAQGASSSPAQGSVGASPVSPAQQLDAPLPIQTSQQPSDISPYASAMERVLEAFRTRRYMSVNDLFDIEGLDVYTQLQKYGTIRLVGEQNLTYFKGTDGTVTVRGMQASFSFTSPKKVTFTEDLVFTFNKDQKITNIAFGIGKVASEDILCSQSSWGDELKEQIMEFMENYKTAYCLKRLDYICDIFSDDAVIIVGKVTHRSGSSTRIGEHDVTQVGRDIITHNRYTKDQYLQNLDNCFRNPHNKYINVKFGENEVQTLRSIEGHKVFGIQIKQFYNSATYGDIGYLFLIVDMTDPKQPQIKVRTWQPNETPIDELFHAGKFYD